MKRAKDEMREFFMRDMKFYEAPEEPAFIKSICWAIIAVIVLFAVYSKTAQDEESFKAEQAFKLERK